MSWVEALPGIRERLETVQGLRAIYQGEPTAIHEWPAAFYQFGEMPRNQRGQVIANRYIVSIVVVVAWQDNATAETDLAPFINRIPAAFDVKLEDGNGHQYATLGGRVNIAEITNVQGGYVEIGKAKWRMAIFTLSVLDKGPTGSGL